MTPLIALYKGTGLVSSAIRWQTDSPYTHAAVYFPSTGKVIESMQGKGVRHVKLDTRDEVEFYEVAGRVDWGKVQAFLEGELGAPYDYAAIVRFVTRFRGRSNKAWICSELVFEAVRHGGVNLLERIEAHQVSPGKLALSPLLILTARQRAR